MEDGQCNRPQNGRYLVGQPADVDSGLSRVQAHVAALQGRNWRS